MTELRKIDVAAASKKFGWPAWLGDAGGKRIRTLGPTLTKVSAATLPKGDPRTTGWGRVLSSGPLMEIGGITVFHAAGAA